MATIKNNTDLEQSKKLSKMLEWKTADMTWVNVYDENNMLLDHRLDLTPFRFYQGIGVPAWSLTALLDLLPFYILTKVKNGYIKVTCKNHSYYSKVAVDAVYELLVNLKENKLI